MRDDVLIEEPAGQDFVFVCQYVDRLTGRPVDPTGKSFAFVAKNTDPAHPSETFTVSTGFTVTDTVNGLFTFTVPRANTTSYGGKRFAWQLWDVGANRVIRRGEFRFSSNLR